MSLGPVQDFLVHATYSYDPEVIEAWEREGLRYLVKIAFVYDVGYSGYRKQLRERIRRSGIEGEGEETRPGIREMIIKFFRGDTNERKEIYELSRAICLEEFAKW